MKYLLLAFAALLLSATAAPIPQQIGPQPPAGNAAPAGNESNGGASKVDMTVRLSSSSISMYK